MIRQVEEETRRDADRRARSILAAVMQRVASSHAVETTVSVVELKSDELKGRIIGREGRNIRALETLTGIDFIIDDTPGAVLLSGFDGVRREIAAADPRAAAPGRAHPPGAHRGGLPPGEVGDRPAHRRGGGAGGLRGERRLDPPGAGQAARQAQLPHELRAERAPPLDRVRAPGAPMLADELGADPRGGRPRGAAARHRQGRLARERGPARARRAASCARRYKESEAVAHAMEAHHNEVEPQTVEAVIVQIVDALSGARPGGARRVARALRQAPARAGGDRHAGTRAWTRSTRCTPAARSA